MARIRCSDCNETKFEVQGFNCLKIPDFKYIISDLKTVNAMCMTSTCYTRTIPLHCKNVLQANKIAGFLSVWARQVRGDAEGR